MNPICTDDYGESVYSTIFFGLLWASQAKRMNSYYPGLRGWKPVPLDYDVSAEIRAFNENDENCNTCVHLLRTKHVKCQSGFLQGRCKKKDIPIKFHPEDCMFPINRNCYEHR